MAKNKSAAQSSKSSKIRYAYRVRLHQWDEVKIERLQILRVSQDSVVYISAFSAEFTDLKRGPSHRWFSTHERAKKYALKQVADRVSFYEATIARLHAQAKDIRLDKIRVGTDGRMVIRSKA